MVGITSIGNTAETAVSGDRMRPLSAVLLEQTDIAPTQMLAALGAARATRAPLERVVLAEALASPEELRDAQSRTLGVLALDRARQPPDPEVMALLPPELCLQFGVLPWMRLGDAVVLAMASRAGFERMARRLEIEGHSVIMAVATETDIEAAISEQAGARLAHRAETRLPAEESCRDFGRAVPGVRRMQAAAWIFVTAVALTLWPLHAFAAVLLLAIVVLAASQVMRFVALLASDRSVAPSPPPALPSAGPVPLVSLLVPLFREEDIAQRLIRRIDRLDYPRSRLEVILILEEGDALTRATLAATALPPFMRVVCVPAGTCQTKPRALNYALNFAHGEIVGILDAEDAPAPDQIASVVARFAAAPASTACLQGVLDFYNPHANWLSRCFTIEYATWFRLVLPGLTRLGFAIPLGGTTVYIRRAALEAVRGWDSHNVTEDADLGIRLARHGFRTEMVATETFEEANNRPWAWVKQRSRWIKGYMITWWVHSRAPRRLWQTLGARKFLGFHLVFLTAILQFVLAPALWSFWLIPLGLPHPLRGLMGPDTLSALTVLFLSCEALSLAIAVTALARAPHDRLMRWTPTMILYFPLATCAAYKALWELGTRPFYWDKTMHGHSAPDAALALAEAQSGSEARESSFSRVTNATEM